MKYGVHVYLYIYIYRVYNIIQYGIAGYCCYCNVRAGPWQCQVLDLPCPSLRDETAPSSDVPLCFGSTDKDGFPTTRFLRVYIHTLIHT